ncbi:MAG: hypothetical protein Q9169_000618 [Polycauliona sp. 2 TL-2023]
MEQRSFIIPSEETSNYHVHRSRAHTQQGKSKTKSTAHEEPAEPILPSRANTEQSDQSSFETFYLKQVTAEFADDLDKLRNASDFNEGSMPILIEALKNTASVYSEEEKADVLGPGK